MVLARGGAIISARMTTLVLAALFLPISHFGISSTSLRQKLVARLGERGYLGFYSLVSVVAFGWLVIAYRHAPAHLLWVAPLPLRVFLVVVVFVAFALGVIGIATPNPTTVGADALLDRSDIARGVLRITRNPFLWGVALWAFAHVAATGELSSIVLFASVGSLGWIGSFLLDAKKARQHGERWRRFARATSNVPFVAILDGRQRLRLGELGVWRVAIAIAVFVSMFLSHARLFGVPPLPLR
jgi:uncharacterized membrane protein